MPMTRPPYSSGFRCTWLELVRSTCWSRVREFCIGTANWVGGASGKQRARVLPVRLKRKTNSASLQSPWSCAQLEKTWWIHVRIEVSGGLPTTWTGIVAIGGDRSVAGPAVRFSRADGVGIGGGFRRSVRGRRRRQEIVGQPQAAWDVSVPEFDGRADDEVVGCVLALRWEDRLWSGMEGWPRRFPPGPTTGCARGRPSLARQLGRRCSHVALR